MRKELREKDKAYELLRKEKPAMLAADLAMETDEDADGEPELDLDALAKMVQDMALMAGEEDPLYVEMHAPPSGGGRDDDDDDDPPLGGGRDLDLGGMSSLVAAS